MAMRLVSTLFILGLATIAQTITTHGHALHHRGLVERIPHPIPKLAEVQPVARKKHRRNCRPRSASSSSTATVASLSTAIDTSITSDLTKATSTVEKTNPSPSTNPSTSTSTTEIKTTAKGTTTTTSTPASTETSSASSSSSGGHLFTLTNKCSSAVKPVVVSTACGYSPRCADASMATPPTVDTLEAGQTTTITIAKDFVGRIFAQDGSCGASGEDCTMLEFNLDADSFYTPNSYDISNIQGFTQSISLGADGCDTVTCTSPTCSCSDAYPIGDETGCGNDLPVRACGAGNIAFTVVFCP